MFAEQLKMNDGIAVKLQSDCPHTVRFCVNHKAMWIAQFEPKGTRFMECTNCGDQIIEYPNEAASSDKSDKEINDGAAKG